MSDSPESGPASRRRLWIGWAAVLLVAGGLAGKVATTIHRARHVFATDVPIEVLALRGVFTSWKLERTMLYRLAMIEAASERVGDGPVGWWTVLEEYESRGFGELPPRHLLVNDHLELLWRGFLERDPQRWYRLSEKGVGRLDRARRASRIGF